MSVGRQMKGARLEFVLRKIEKPVRTFLSKITSTGIEQVPQSSVDSYMLYLPTGQAFRLTAEAAQQYLFIVKDGKKRPRRAAILNLDKVTDTSSPAGRFKFAVDMEERQQAYKDLEEAVIRTCTRRGDLVKFIEEERDGKAA